MMRGLVSRNGGVGPLVCNVSNSSIWQSGTGVKPMSISQKARRRLSQIFSGIIYLTVGCGFQKCSNQGFLFIYLFGRANTHRCAVSVLCPSANLFLFFNCCCINLGNMSQNCRILLRLQGAPLIMHLFVSIRDIISPYVMCAWIHLFSSF